VILIPEYNYETYNHEMNVRIDVSAEVKNASHSKTDTCYFGPWPKEHIVKGTGEGQVITIALLHESSSSPECYTILDVKAD